MSKDFLEESPEERAEKRALSKVNESHSLSQLPEPLRNEITTLVADAVGQALNPLLQSMKRNAELQHRMLKQQQAVSGGPLFDEDWDDQQALAEELDPTLAKRIQDLKG